jgi:hypothetical protein
MSGEQDIRNMGGLKDKIPQTFRTFAIATYAIAGLPLAAGFFSKDEILVSAWSTPYFPGVGKVVWLLGTLAAFCTAFYMYRLVYLTFSGKFRGTHDQEHHLHESPPSMTVPLWILAALSIVGGLLSLPHGIWHGWSLATWLHPVIPEIPGVGHELHIPLQTEIIIARNGKPDAEVAKRAAEKLGPLYPADHFAMNRELCQVLLAVEAPGAVEKTVKLMLDAPTQEEQIWYAHHLRTAKAGWTRSATAR